MVDRCLLGQQQAHVTVLIFSTTLTTTGGPCPLACQPPLAWKPPGPAASSKCVSPEGQVLGETGAAWLCPEASPHPRAPLRLVHPVAQARRRPGFLHAEQCARPDAPSAAEGLSPPPSEHAAGPGCFRSRPGPHLLCQALC